MATAWQFLDEAAKSPEAVHFLTKRRDKEAVVQQLLKAAGLETPREAGLRQIQDLAWVHRNLGFMRTRSERVLQMTAEALQRALRRGWGPEQWSAALLLKDEGVLNELQVVFETEDLHVARELRILADDPPRHVTTTKSLWHLSWEHEHLNHIGNHYKCFRCVANAQCQVVGCTRRPLDCFCPNYKVRGETFRYEWKHPRVDDSGRALHVCGKCAKSGFYYKQETVDNHRRATARWNAGYARKPKATTFPKLTLDDGRCFQIGYVEDFGEWWLVEQKVGETRLVKPVS